MSVSAGAVLKQSLESDEFIKLTLSKPAKTSDLKNIYVRPIALKGETYLSFTLRYPTRDEVKNYLPGEAIKEVESDLENNFHILSIFTSSIDYTFKRNKRGIKMFSRPSTLTKAKEEHHDRKKHSLVVPDRPYLFHLGLTDKSGQMIPSMADKFRQINKFLEIIDDLLKQTQMEEPLEIVDMGSGKGYLTFALYDHLTFSRQMEVRIIGVELRQDLVDFCNEKADACNYDNLLFEAKRIEDFHYPSVDMLIALHACDTATDDAIGFGIDSHAKLIVTAPCCHKQVRKDTEGKKTDDPLMKHGIFRERQFEMVTDILRSLYMEKHQYRTRIFEFVSNEHTRKNVMMVGVKASKPIDTDTDGKINEIKTRFQVEKHHLEDLLEKN